jgi:organic hydroperoxide reductase OsmC/OhrA
MGQEFAVTLTWQQGYAFAIDFEMDGIPELMTDEPAPLGEGLGPNPARLLAAAVGNCMSASLKFCLERAHLDVQDLRTRVEGTLVRNERGRMRIASLRVRLEPTLQADHLERIGRCLEVFEDFCIVGQSVREGIDLSVEVVPTAAPVALVPG